MLRTPATTSSPCALSRKSPSGLGSPSVGSRPETRPRRRSSRRGCRTPSAARSPPCRGNTEHRSRLTVMVAARSLPQESKTARTAKQQLGARVLGEVLAGRAAVERRRSGRRARAGQQAPSSHVGGRLRHGAQLGERSPRTASAGTPRTTSPNICSSRRRESRASASSPRRASPATASSVSPRLRIVSSIPGIKSWAPERTESSSGSGDPRSRDLLALERLDSGVNLGLEAVRKIAE